MEQQCISSLESAIDGIQLSCFVIFQEEALFQIYCHQVAYQKFTQKYRRILFHITKEKLIIVLITTFADTIYSILYKVNVPAKE